METARFRETISLGEAHPTGIQQVEAAVQRAVRRVREERERAVRDRDVRRPVWKSTFYGAFHAIDAKPARFRGDAGFSPLDGARTAASSPRHDLVKNYRVYPTHWLIIHTGMRHG